jgi:hypothetical protein
MKFSISVPDDLWAEAATDGSTGPSDLVQQALRALISTRQPSDQPLAHAPDSSKLSEYRPLFSASVDRLTQGLREIVDSGYRLGLVLAADLSPTDFELLDNELTARRALQLAFRERGDPNQVVDEDPNNFSSLFWLGVQQYFEDGLDLLGEPGEIHPGLIWEYDPDLEHEDHLGWCEGYRIRLAPQMAKAAVDAMRDVRDQALRDLAGAASDEEVAP